MTPDDVVLVYVGNLDGQGRYIVGYPKADITRGALDQMSQAEGVSADDMLDKLLAYDGMWELSEGQESATIEGTSGTFPDEAGQAPGEAASEKRRRRES